MSFLTTLKQTRSGRIFITLFKIILCVIVGVFIFWQYLIWPNYWDDKTINNDADLLPVVSEPIPASKNAATYVPIQSNTTEAEQVILDKEPSVKDGKFYLGTEEVSGLKLQQFIAESKPLVIKFEQSASQSAYQCPSSFGQYQVETKLCELGNLRSLSFLTLFHAQYQMNIGDINRASQLTTAVLRFSHMVVDQENPPALIEYLVGLALYGGALTVIESNEDLRVKMNNDLDTYYISDASNGRIIQAEYAMLKNGILQVFVGQTDEEKKVMTSGTYYMRQNETINNLAEVMRATVSDVVTPCNLALDTPPKSTVLIEKYQNTDSLIGMIQPNFLGRVFLQTMLADLTGTRSTRCGINARIEALSSN